MPNPTPGLIPIWIDPTLNLLQILVSFAGIVLGAWIIRWQLQKQHLNNVSHQQASFRDELNLKIFDSISERLLVAQSKLSAASMTIWPLGSRLEYHWKMKDTYLPNIDPMRERALQINDLNAEAHAAINELVFILERYQTPLPNFDVFRLAFNFHFREQLDAFAKLYDKVLQFLPFTIPPEMIEKGMPSSIQTNRPTPAEILEIKARCEIYFNVIQNQQGILFDLNVEAQNALLGNIFPIQAPTRKPLDQKIKVIVTSGPGYQMVKAFYQGKFDELEKSLFQPPMVS